MDDRMALAAVLDMVPNWYGADVGPVRYDLRLGGEVLEFWGHRRPTPALRRFIEVVRHDIEGVVSRLDPFADVVAVDLLQEYFALEWLSIVAPDIAWQAVLDYSRTCMLRTYENAEVSFNLVIREGAGEHRITDATAQKILDPLAASLRTYFEVDTDLRITGYDEISWDDVEDERDYAFAPEFLRPFVCVLQGGEHSVHQTSRGDLVIMNHEGLIAAKRKGRWKIYDVATLKNSITDALGQYRIGANLFETCFDLSFRRHGALLIYDPMQDVIENVVNVESCFHRGEQTDIARKMLEPSVGNLSMRALEREERKKLLLLELASIDGAVIFDDDSILAVGAMVRTHQAVPGEAGARTTAARSAFLFGGRPVKISSDGEIAIYFSSSDGEGERADASLEFL